MADNLLNVEGLTLHYGGSQILHGIDLSVARGEVTCITGTNGVGKTSLLNALAGTHPVSGGIWKLDGDDVSGATAHALARRGIGYVPQGRDIFPFLTVKENLETGFACLPPKDRSLPKDIFDLFPVLGDFMNRRGGDLSGGQQQQLAIARALVIKPKVLLLDEPTEGIQPNVIQQIGAAIDRLREQGKMAIVLVEQYLSFAFERGDQFHVLERGVVKYSARKEDTSLKELQSQVSL